MPELNTSEAVRSFDIHPNMLYRLILMGRIPARKDADGHYRLSRESLERWNANRVRRSPKHSQPVSGGEGR